MTIEYIYNPVAKQSVREKLAEIYYGSAAGQFAVEATFFIVGLAVIAAAVVVFAA